MKIFVCQIHSENIFLAMIPSAVWGATLWLLLVLAANSAADNIKEEVSEETSEVAKERVNRLSEQVRAVMEHYKQEDPIGLPGAAIPDPMPLPRINGVFATIKNGQVYGLSKFKVEKMDFDLANIQVYSEVSYANLTMTGQYGWAGRKTVSLMDALVKCNGTIKVDDEGKLQVTDLKMDIDNKEINSGTSSLQGLQQLMFKMVKPFMMEETQRTIRATVNKELKNLQTFPTSIQPIDLAFAKGRQFVRDLGYDPYTFDDYPYSAGILSANVSNIVVSGLASFYRTGEISVQVRNHTLRLGLEVATQRLLGTCNWELSMLGIPTRSGSSKFSIEYLRVLTHLNQSLDVRNRPNLKELSIDLGNIQLRNDGLGTLDYVLELVINFLPNILRTVIVDTLQGHLKDRIQDMLDSIDVENEIEYGLRRMEYESGTKTVLNPPEDMYKYY